MICLRLKNRHRAVRHSVEQQFYRGLSVLISLNGPLDAAVCLRFVSGTATQNEGIMNTLCPQLLRTKVAISSEKIRFQKLSACPRTWLLPNRTMKCARFSRKIICVFETLAEDRFMR